MLEFSWPSVSHPQFDTYEWHLFTEEGNLITIGHTKNSFTEVSVDLGRYYLEIYWRHLKSGRWQHHHTTAVLTYEEDSRPELTAKFVLYANPSDPNPVPFEDGEELSGNEYIGLVPNTEISGVNFWIDATYIRWEGTEPYMLGGDEHGELFPFDTHEYENGSYVITAEIFREGHETVEVSVVVEIYNEVIISPPPVDPPYEVIAELPRKKVDISYPQLTGKEIIVRQGQSVQSAINQAEGGDTILIEPGTYNEQLVISKSNEQPVLIRSSGFQLESRAAPGASGVNFVHNNATNRMLQFTSEARNYYIKGLEFDYTPDVVRTTGSMISTGHASKIILDQVVASMGDVREIQRALTMNGENLAAIGCYFKAGYKGADSQAILIFDGAGPFHIENCYLAGAGENIMVGGATAKVALPSDITILNNFLHKPDIWRNGRFTVKNLFEIKFGVRFLLDGNILEGNWRHGQDGHGINIKRSSAGLGDQISDFTFTNNIFIESDHGFKIGSTFPRVYISNNQAYEIHGRMFTILSSKDLHILNNTFRHDSSIIISTNENNAGFVARGNIWGSSGGYGIKGSGAEGTSTLNADFPGHVYENNGHIGRREERYPEGNLFVETEEEVLDSLLRPIGPFKDIGAKF